MCAGCVPGNDLPLTYLTLAAARGALTWHRYVGVATAAVAGPPPAALPPTAAGVRSDREGASGVGEGGGGGGRQVAALAERFHQLQQVPTVRMQTMRVCKSPGWRVAPRNPAYTRTLT